MREIGWTGGAEIEMLRDSTAGAGCWSATRGSRRGSMAHAVRAQPAGGADPPRARNPRRPRARSPIAPSSPAWCSRFRSAPSCRCRCREPEHGKIGASSKYGAALAAIVPMLAPPGGKVTMPIAWDAPAATAESPLTPSRRHLGRNRGRSARRDAVGETPHRLFRRARRGGVRARRTPHRRPPSSPELRFAYSLKTCPDLEYLEAGAQGRHARRVHQPARGAPCAGGRLVAGRASCSTAPASGGPRPSRPWTACARCSAIRSRSSSGSPRRGARDRLWGVRLRVPGFRSRFGVAVDEPEAFERLCARRRRAAGEARLRRPRAHGEHADRRRPLARRRRVGGGVGGDDSRPTTGRPSRRSTSAAAIIRTTSRASRSPTSSTSPRASLPGLEPRSTSSRAAR